MDFSCELKPNERVIWNAQIEKQRHDQQLKLPPPVAEHKPAMAGEKGKRCRHPVREDRDQSAGPFRVKVDEQVIASLRQKWGVKL